MDPFISYRTLTKKDWLDREFYDSEQKREGRGEQGKGFSINTEGNESLARVVVSAF